MSAKHTQGPWRYQPYGQDSNYMLIFCSSREGEGDNLRGYCGEPNARLISAAPELYTLAYRVSMLNRDAGEIGSGMLASLVDEATHLVAKATGESHE